MERRKMKKKGFTLVELLVVIAIIAMLLAILMPALGKVRQLAQRIMCSTNLAGLGKAMLVYSNDDKYESFPIAGSSGAYWDRGTGGNEGVSTFDWRIPKFTDTGTPPRATISSCLYLLVKIADTTPEQFICPGSDQKKFDFSTYTMLSGTAYSNLTFTDVWDFGSKDTVNTAQNKSRGKGHNSYSYQLPLPLASGQSGAYPITTTTNPARAVMADRNPYWSSPVPPTGSPVPPPYLYNFDETGNKLRAESIPNGNSTYHQKDGQNVLYADLHAKFEKSANCGIQQDNIYTYWGIATIAATTDEKFRQCGKGAVNAATNTTFENPQTSSNTDPTCRPQNEEDNYLVSDVDKG